MTVYDIINMFIEEEEQRFEVWDNEQDEVIFKGCLEDCPEDIQDEIVTSIDNINKYNNRLTLNIH